MGRFDIDNGQRHERHKHARSPFNHMDILLSAQQMSYWRQQELIRHARVFDQYQYEKDVLSSKRGPIQEEPINWTESEPVSPSGPLSPESSLVLSPPPRQSRAIIQPLLLSLAESMRSSAPATDVDLSKIELPWEVSTPTAEGLRERLSQIRPGLQSPHTAGLHHRLSAPTGQVSALLGGHQGMAAAGRRHREQLTSRGRRYRLGRPGALVAIPAGYHASIQEVQQHCRLKAANWRRTSEPNPGALAPVLMFPELEFERSSAPSIPTLPALRMEAQQESQGNSIQDIEAEFQELRERPSVLQPLSESEEGTKPSTPSASTRTPHSPSHPFRTSQSTELLPSLRNKLRAVRAWHK